MDENSVNARSFDEEPTRCRSDAPCALGNPIYKHARCVPLARELGTLNKRCEPPHMHGLASITLLDGRLRSTRLQRDKIRFAWTCQRSTTRCHDDATRAALREPACSEQTQPTDTAHDDMASNFQMAVDRNAQYHLANDQSTLQRSERTLRLARHSQSSPTARRWTCLCGRPAVPSTTARTRCAYSTAFSPTPPAAAWITMQWLQRCLPCAIATCDVLHTTGRVDTSSNVSAAGLRVIIRVDVQARDASGASATPNTASPTVCFVNTPAALRMPAASLPGGPGSPGYSPSTLSTSRKLRPTARTRSSTCVSLVAKAGGRCSTKRFVIAPRE
eukprot:1770531-Prymnesium_polylepis.2